VEAGVEVDAKSTNLKTRGNTRQAQKQDKKERDTPPPLTVEAALWLVRGGDGSLVTENKSTKASKEVNAALDERLAKYPEAAIESMHRCVAMLPGRIHLLLKKEPTLIAAAVVSISHLPHSASLIAHTRLTLSAFISSGERAPEKRGRSRGENNSRV
jgi:hypothetical protein